jgi:hypothetical protein
MKDIQSNKLRFLRWYQLTAIHSLQAAVAKFQINNPGFNPVEFDGIVTAPRRPTP